MESEYPAIPSEREEARDIILARESDIALELTQYSTDACDAWCTVFDILMHAEEPDDRANICAALLGIGAELHELNEKVGDPSEHGIVTYTR